jgi:hypothetical protein
MSEKNRYELSPEGVLTEGGKVLPAPSPLAEPIDLTTLGLGQPDDLEAARLFLRIAQTPSTTYLPGGSTSQ